MEGSTTLLLDKAAESVDLSGRGLSDLAPLQGCTSLASLSLRNNGRLRSCDGLERCIRLWTVDLRGCDRLTADGLCAALAASTADGVATAPTLPLPALRSVTLTACAAATPTAVELLRRTRPGVRIVT